MTPTPHHKGKLSKQELKQDKLVALAYKVEHFYLIHQKWVISIAIGIVVIVAGAMFVSRSTKGAKLEEAYQLTMAKMQLDAGQVTEAGDALNRLVSSAGGAVAAEAKFLTGRIAFEQKNYSQALEIFTAYMNDYAVDDELDCAAMCGLAAAYKAMGKTDESVKTYGEVAKKYASTNCAPVALWESYRIYSDLKQIDNATAALRSLRDSYGESTLAAKAKQELEAIAFRAP